MEWKISYNIIKNSKSINNQFKIAYIFLIYFNLNFRVLFAFLGNLCKCHNYRLYLKNILEKHTVKANKSKIPLTDN